MDSNTHIQELVRACRQGDRQAQFQLYQQYAAAMLNTSFRILNHHQDAEDALQEAFLKAFSRIEQYRSESTFGAWLKRIVVNTAVSHLRKKRELWTEEAGSEIRDSHLAEGENEWQCTHLEKAYIALHQLPDGYRTVFSLYLLEGYDHTEISQILGISVSTSISQFSRAKKKIRILIKQTEKTSWTL